MKFHNTAECLDLDIWHAVNFTLWYHFYAATLRLEIYLPSKSTLFSMVHIWLCIASVLLHFILMGFYLQYPKESPHVYALESKGLDENRQAYLISSIQNKAKELSDYPMLVTLCEVFLVFCFTYSWEQLFHIIVFKFFAYLYVSSRVETFNCCMCFFLFGESNAL